MCTHIPMGAHMNMCTGMHVPGCFTGEYVCCMDA